MLTLHTHAHKKKKLCNYNYNPTKPPTLNCRTWAIIASHKGLECQKTFRKNYWWEMMILNDRSSTSNKAMQSFFLIFRYFLVVLKLADQHNTTTFHLLWICALLIICVPKPQFALSLFPLSGFVSFIHFYELLNSESIPSFTIWSPL